MEEAIGNVLGHLIPPLLHCLVVLPLLHLLLQLDSLLLLHTHTHHSGPPISQHANPHSARPEMHANPNSPLFTHQVTAHTGITWSAV
eukprot:2924646-Rhodomonas_salina.1